MAWQKALDRRSARAWVVEGSCWRARRKPPAGRRCDCGGIGSFVRGVWLRGVHRPAGSRVKKRHTWSGVRWSSCSSRWRCICGSGCTSSDFTAFRYRAPSRIGWSCHGGLRCRSRRPKSHLPTSARLKGSVAAAPRHVGATSQTCVRFRHKSGSRKSALKQRLDSDMQHRAKCGVGNWGSLRTGSRGRWSRKS
jgi:hypothetical protein